MVMASHIDSVLTFVRNRAAENRVAASTIWRTGSPSSYMMSRYASALNLTSSCLSATLKRRGALQLRWQDSHRAVISFSISRVDELTAFMPARFRRL